jgi:hypothetical protein
LRHIKQTTPHRTKCDEQNDDGVVDALVQVAALGRRRSRVADQLGILHSINKSTHVRPSLDQQPNNSTGQPTPSTTKIQGSDLPGVEDKSEHPRCVHQCGSAPDDVLERDAGGLLALQLQLPVKVVQVLQVQRC